MEILILKNEENNKIWNVDNAKFQIIGSTCSWYVVIYFQTTKFTSG